MERVRGVIKVVLIVILMVVITKQTTIHAKETQTVTTNQVSIKLPLELEVYIDDAGNVGVPEFRIENIGTTSVMLKEIEVQVDKEWSMVEYGKDYRKEKVNIREFGMRIGEHNIPTRGIVTLEEEIGVGESLGIEVDLTVAVQSEPMNGERVANVIFKVAPYKVGNKLVIRDSEVKIKEKEYESREDITGVDIEASKVTIGEKAFRYASNIETLRVRASKVSIDEDAFIGCINLRKIDIEGDEIEIKEYAFEGLPNLEYLIIRGNKIKIEEKAFRGGGLQQIDIEGSDIKIETKAYHRNKEMRKISIKGNTIRVESGAFGGNTNLIEVTIVGADVKVSENAYRE